MNDIVTTDKPTTVADQLKVLNREIRIATNALSQKQLKFVRALVKGESKTQAAIKAGYAKSTAHGQATRLYGLVWVAKSLELMRHKDQLQHGIDAGYKRQILLNIAEQVTRIGTQAYAPGIAIKAINELNRMDGHHTYAGNATNSPSVTGNIQINIVTGVPDNKNLDKPAIIDVQPTKDKD